MAVYTTVSEQQITDLLRHYELGELLSFEGIAEGVENSNYLLRTGRNRFILTLYEKRVREQDLPFFLALMEHLSRRGVICPAPLCGRDGRVLRRVAGRSAALFEFLPGAWPRRILPAHCRKLGRGLAQLHLAGADFPQQRVNDLSLPGWRNMFSTVAARADEVKTGLAAMIGEELEILQKHWPQDLPRGVCHADLFPDNAFFRKGELSGIIDFYFACTDMLAYDLAICLNAWCFDAAGNFAPRRGQALLEGYQELRPLSQAEQTTLPILARGAALRFLLTRLYDLLNHPPGALVTPKDPLQYAKRLRFHRRATGPHLYGLPPEQAGRPTP